MEITPSHVMSDDLTCQGTMTSLPPVSIAGVDDDQPNIHRNTHEHKWILVLQQQQCFLDSPQIAASSHDYGTCQCMPYGHYDS
jgi:hypothetical protein